MEEPEIDKYKEIARSIESPYEQMQGFQEQVARYGGFVDKSTTASVAKNVDLPPETPCVCPVCKKRFLVKEMVKRQAEYHGAQSQRGLYFSRKIYYRDAYVCKECDETLSQNSVKVHVISWFLFFLLIGITMLLSMVSCWLSFIPGIIIIYILYGSITGAFHYYKMVGETLKLKWFISIFE